MRDEGPKREIDWSVGPKVIVAIQRGERFYEVDTGLRGALIIERNPPEFVIPMRDDITAEEVARIVTGTIRRELT